MGKVEVSIIIPAYNAEKTIQECVGSVLKNDYDDFEVIVVDDGSTDNTKKNLGNINDERLKCIFNEFNKGASFARNCGIKKSEGDIILLLDADSYVQRDWIESHIKAHKSILADIIGGGVIGVFRTIYGRCDNFCNWWPSIPYSRSCYITKLHIPTNNLSIKRDVFQKIGYFNEDLKTGEDADFCFRAIKNGQKIFFKSDLVIYHHDKDSFGGFLRHQETWGRHALKMRRGNNMDFSWILPGSRLTGYLSIPHLSILYTGFIVMKWVKYDLSVLPLSPVILLGKIKQALAIAGSVERAKK